jgi:hypothetical protein
MIKNLTIGVSVLGPFVAGAFVDDGRRLAASWAGLRTDSTSSVAAGTSEDATRITVDPSGQVGAHAVLAGAKTTGFAIKGHAKGLWPGHKRPLRLTVSNPHRYAIVVTRAGVRVRTDLTHQRCGAKDYVRKTRFTGRLTIPARSSRSIALSIRLLYRAPDECQGATFPLLLRGRAVRA